MTSFSCRYSPTSVKVKPLPPIPVEAPELGSVPVVVPVPVPVVVGAVLLVLVPLRVVVGEPGMGVLVGAVDPGSGRKTVTLIHYYH